MSQVRALPLPPWRVVREVYCPCLENKRSSKIRGFESHTLLQKKLRVHTNLLMTIGILYNNWRQRERHWGSIGSVEDGTNRQNPFLITKYVLDGVIKSRTHGITSLLRRNIRSMREHGQNYISYSSEKRVRARYGSRQVEFKSSRGQQMGVWWSGITDDFESSILGSIPSAPAKKKRCIMKARKSKKIKYNPIKREEEIFAKPLTEEEKKYLKSFNL